MRKPVTVALFLIVPLVLLGVAGVSQAQFTLPTLYLYDDFRLPPIDPALWSGSESSAGLSAPNTESARKLEGKQLHIGLTTWGNTTSNTGSPGTQANRLAFTDPGPITTIQADVTVKKSTVVGCALNATSSRARARILGIFFNDGSSTGAGNRLGDIFGIMQMHRDSLLGDQILASIVRCENAGCSAFSNPLPPVAFAASWVTRVASTMTLQWDQPNHQFIFTLNPGAHQEQQTINYFGTLTDTHPPIVAFKALDVGNSAANCLGPAPRASALMWALFDNVMTDIP